MRINNFSEKGMTVASMFLVVVFLAFMAITLIKLYPSYYDDLSVGTALENLSFQDGSSKMSPKDIIATMDKRLQVNGISSIKAEDFVVKKDKGVTTVELNYEVRTEMYGNIDAITKFSHKVELTK